MTNPELPKPIAPAFNFVQRSIQGVFGTREFAVVLLIVFCFAVEIGILAATQRYESNTKPPGTELFWGMSAAGMVVFFAEVLKLPVAWVSGVVRGRRRWTLNVITFGLCALTAITIKDLTVYEWDQALQPARALASNAATKRAKIAALEREREALERDSYESNTDIETRLAQIEEDLKSADSRKVAIERRLTSVLGLPISARPEYERLAARKATIEQTREDSREKLQAELRTLDGQRDSLRARWQREQEKVSAAYQASLSAWNDRKSDRARRRTSIIDKHQQLIANLPPDTPFSGEGTRRRMLEESKDKQLSDVEREEQQDPAPMPPGTDSPELRLIDAREKDIRARYDGIDEEQRRELGRVDADLDRLLTASRNSTGIAVEQSRTANPPPEQLELDRVNREIAGLSEAKLRLQQQRELLQNPEYVANRKKEIRVEIQELASAAKQEEEESQRLAEDTNPIRASSGIVRWLMPGSTLKQQEEAAYGIFPIVIGILVATLPAVLLELSVSSLRSDIIADEAKRPSLLLRLSRRRRALLLLQHRAAMASQRAESTLEQMELRRQALLAEFEQRRQALSQEVEEAVAERLKELETETAALQAQIIEAQKREAALATQLADTTTQLRKLSEDNAALAAHVVHLDARRPPAPV